jgi:FdhD protein
MDKPPGSKASTTIWSVIEGQGRSRSDQLAVEEPLEIRLLSPQRTLAVTMRTPGTDFDLTAGFLFAEGLINHRDDIQRLSYCVDPQVDGSQRYNIVNVALQQPLDAAALQPLERHFFTTSACGVCGKASIEALQIRGCNKTTGHEDHIRLDPDVIYHLPNELRAAQGIFAKTGGLHAAALFDLDGKLLRVREDVGRHNALDKLIGAALLADELPLNRHIVMVSGRSSFELVQKCVMAQVPILCAVSAPSSLAVAVACEFGMTLIGFLREQRFNVYAGRERLEM